MLYEVITIYVEAFLGTALIAIMFGYVRYVSNARAAFIRITSYNVCYTKLLRIH